VGCGDVDGCVEGANNSIVGAFVMVMVSGSVVGVFVS